MKMRRSHRKIEILLQRLGALMRSANNDEERDRYRRLYGIVKGLEESMELDFEELQNMLIRNGAYPGDMVGWLDDDFTLDDDDDDESDEEQAGAG